MTDIDSTGYARYVGMGESQLPGLVERTSNGGDDTGVIQEHARLCAPREILRETQEVIVDAGGGVVGDPAASASAGGAEGALSHGEADAGGATTHGEATAAPSQMGAAAAAAANDDDYDNGPAAATSSSSGSGGIILAAGGGGAFTALAAPECVDVVSSVQVAQSGGLRDESEEASMAVHNTRVQVEGGGEGAERMGGAGEIRVDVGALNDASSPRVGDDAGAGLGLIAAEPGAVGGVEPGAV